MSCFRCRARLTSSEEEPAAGDEGRVAVEVMAGENVAFAPCAIPAVVFTDPELAWCGLTEAQAAKEGRHVTVAKFPWGASGRAITLDRTDGLTKLILDPGTERLLGVGLVGPNAAECYVLTSKF